MNGTGEIGCRSVWGRAYLLTVGVVLWAGGCDLGGRQQLSAGVDSGIDSGDTGDGEDTDTDSGSDNDTDWRYVDAGSGWDDGSVEISGSCDNECLYLYHVLYNEWDEFAGQSLFEISPASADTVLARGIDSYRYILWYSWPNYELYRQRLLSSFVLDSITHEMVSGEALVYNRYGGTTRLKRYEFEYGDSPGEFHFTVDTEGRRWTRTFSVSSPPLVMFNLREFPLEGYGSHSSLFAFLLGERYDWSAGGEQLIQVFSPEQERLATIAVEAGGGADTLILHYPVDMAQSGDEDIPDHDPNNAEYVYQFGIPVHFNTRLPFRVEVVSGTPLELNIGDVPESVEVQQPVPIGGYGSSPLSVVVDDATLAGIVDDPDGVGPHPVVVILPGWDHVTRNGEVGAVDLFAQLADRLAAAGYLVARTDARGNGASSGALEQATVEDLVADAEAVAATVAALTEGDADQVYLLATGLGAHVAAAAATGGVVDVAGVILLSPIGSDYQEQADEVHAHFLENGGFHETYVLNTKFTVMDVMDALADGTYSEDYFRGHSVASWQSLLGRSLIDDPPALPPTLVVSGTEDHVVPSSEVNDLVSALSGASVPVTIAQLDGLTNALTVGTATNLWPEHSSVEKVDDAAVQALIEWLDVQTGGE